MSLTIEVRGPKFTSTTLTDFGANARTGMVRQFSDETWGVRSYMLLKASGTIADAILVVKDGTSSSEVTVLAATADSVIIVAVNNTGGSISSGTYFWGCLGPIFYVDPDGTGWNDGAKVGPANTGVCQAAVTGDVCIGVAVNDDDATTNSNNIILGWLPSSGALV